MNPHEYLSDDGHALLLLATAFALPAEVVNTGAAPLKLSEWNALSKRIAQSPLQRPGALLGKSVDELAGALNASADEAQRLASLLERSGRATLEMENLFTRGIWVVTRVDAHYPTRLRDALKHQAPAVLFGAGDIRLLARAGVAVVGSRNVDEAGVRFAQAVARKAANAGVPVISGGARGTDRIAMQAALDPGGISFGVLADSLDRTVRQTDVRQFLLDDRLVLCTPYLPGAGFSVGGAMGRNKVIYGLASHAVVVASEHESGGTWAGAVEALKGNYCPVFVREAGDAPKGNRELLKLGATGLSDNVLTGSDNLLHWFGEHSAARPSATDLFDFALREKSE